MKFVYSFVKSSKKTILLINKKNILNQLILDKYSLKLQFIYHETNI